MFASIENNLKIELRLNHEGKSIVIATLKNIEDARTISDLMNRHCEFNERIFYNEWNK